MKYPFIFGAGIAWLVMLAVAFFIPLTVDAGDNYVVQDTLLGLIIFHHPLVLAAYVLIGVAASAWGWGVRILLEQRKTLKGYVPGNRVMILKGGIV